MKWAVACLMFIALNTQAYNTSIKGWVNLRTEGIIRQTTDFSCGPAALSLLLKERFGVEINEIDIISDILYRAEPGSEKEKLTNGFSLLDLKKESERMGFKARGVKYDLEDISHISKPLIIPLDGRDYSHFVVLIEIKNNFVDVLDPERGKLQIPIYELKSRWKGYALIIGDSND